MPMRSKAGGGGTSETPIVIDLDDSTAARGNKSLRLILGGPSRTPLAGDKTNLHPATINSNFYRYDNFSDYEDETDLWLVGDWFSGSLENMNSIYKTTVPSIDVTEFNMISFYSKAERPTSVHLSMMDSNNIWTVPFGVYVNSKFWRRYDALIVPSASAPTDFSNQLETLLFEFRGTKNASIWLDEIYFVDERTNSEKTEWISMNVHGENIDHEANVTMAETAGRRGDVIFGTYANNKRGRIDFVTHAPQDEDDLFFLDSIRGNGEMCYIRNVGEGWPIYIEGMSVGVRDTYFGSQRKLSLQFIEDTLQ